MNKTELKNFAINSRFELITRVRDRATLYGITEEKCSTDSIVKAELFQKVDGSLLSKKETDQRKALEDRIRNNGFSQVMEEAAYIWFNRFIALRYMEEHNLLPIDMRVIPQKSGDLPQIVQEAHNISISGIDFSIVLQMLDENRSEELYKYLIISLCNSLSAWLPQMFERINDYTELLFPDGLLKADSFLGMLADTEEDNWHNIQVIGWLYQYYNTELKNETFELLSKSIRITKDRIGAATQLFTPEWIVRYMVENSLGRLWLEGHPNSNLKQKWRYYLDEAPQENQIEIKLAVIRKERGKIQPEEIKLIDPCMGSGHVLVYAFDVLMDIYRSIGYTDRDATQSIIKNNIFGLDIDDRAAQLAYFALMMKASEYDKRFLHRGIQPNVCAIQESNSLTSFNQLKGQMSLNSICINTANQLISAFIDAKEYGSILSPKIDCLTTVDSLMEQLEQVATTDLEVSSWYEKARVVIPQLAKQAIILHQVYDVAITNPPYMSSAGMDNKLSSFVKNLYPDSKNDLFAVFIERIEAMLKETGYQAMITQHAWMFLSGFRKLRIKLQEVNIVNMAHLGARAFEEIGGEIVQTTAFVIQKSHIPGFIGRYIRLTEPNTQQGKEDMFLSGKNTFFAKQISFMKSPGNQIAYWISDKLLSHFGTQQQLFETHAGITTGDNDYFLKNWYEINAKHIYRQKQNDDIIPAWYFHHKGGNFRKWYGNLEIVLHYDKKSIEEMKSRPGFRHDGKDFFFQTCGTWNKTGTGNICVRYSDNGNTFNTGGCCLFCRTVDELYYAIAFLNSNTAGQYISFLCPTFSFAAGDVEKVPVVISENALPRIKQLTEENIEIAKEDWNTYETSWDFKRHFLAVDKCVHQTLSNISTHEIERKETAIKIETQFDRWTRKCTDRFDQLKKNEEELNQIFIDIYGLQEELSPIVMDKNVTVRKADLSRDIRSLISYAVGCMLGRYSLDKDGLMFAGGIWDSSKYVTYLADKDGILPITDDEYFQDDIVSMFVRWVKTVYGDETLEENLQFIANALNTSGGSSRDVIRSYFMNEFYTDHVRMYQKRPIYWQFDSGKQNGFKALIYLHRYDQDTVARLRTDYVHELQDRYRTQLEDAQKTTEFGDARQKAIASKRAQKLDKQLTELNKYEELVHHYADMRISLDLDDGVKVNYAKLQDILTPIK